MSVVKISIPRPDAGGARRTEAVRVAEAEMDSFFCSAVRKEDEKPADPEMREREKTLREKVSDFSDTFGPEIIGGKLGGDVPAETMAEIRESLGNLDPFVHAELLLAVEETSEVEALLDREFVKSLGSLDAYLASSLLYEIRLTGNVEALTDQRMFDYATVRLLAGIGTEAASEVMYSIGATGNIGAITDPRALAAMERVGDSAKVVSELSYAIGQTGRIAELTDGEFMGRLASLRQGDRAELLSAAWCTGKVGELASASAIDQIRSGADLWNDVVRSLYSGGSRPTVVFSKQGGGEHDRGAKLAIKSLVDSGFEVMYLSGLESQEEIARIAAEEGARAVGFSLMDDGLAGVVEGTSRRLALHGLGAVQVFCGGWIAPEGANGLRRAGVKVFGPGTKTSEVSEFMGGLANGVRSRSPHEARTPAKAQGMARAAYQAPQTRAAERHSAAMRPSAVASQTVAAAPRVMAGVSNARPLANASPGNLAGTAFAPKAAETPSGASRSASHNAESEKYPLQAVVLGDGTVQLAAGKARASKNKYGIPANESVPFAPAPRTDFQSARPGRVDQAPFGSRTPGQEAISKLFMNTQASPPKSVNLPVRYSELRTFSANRDQAFLPTPTSARYAVLATSVDSGIRPADRAWQPELRVLPTKRTSAPEAPFIGNKVRKPESRVPKSDAERVPRAMLSASYQIFWKGNGISGDALPTRKGSSVEARLRVGKPVSQAKIELEGGPAKRDFTERIWRKARLFGGASRSGRNPEMGSAPAKSGDGAKGRRHGASASFLGKLILAFLGLLGGISGGFRRLSDYLKARRIERLLLRSDRSIRLLEKEAGAFGIDLHGSGAVDYYSILGIRPGSGQEEIKEAYHELVKKHHPDVSKELDAGQITQKINEAYSALKDGEQRRQYDRSFASGAQAIGAADARRISNELLRRYMKARAEDFARFAEATSGPIQLDDLTAAIDDVCAWKKRFGKVDSAMFKKFTRYGKSVRRLSEANRKLLGRGPEEKAAARLRENSLRLDELSKAYEGVDRSLSAIRKNLRDEVGAQETEVARKLRASVKYA